MADLSYHPRPQRKESRVATNVDYLDNQPVAVVAFVWDEPSI